MSRSLDAHADVLQQVLEPGEVLVSAAGAIVAGRRHRRDGMPRRGFVLVKTDRRLIALQATTWLARPTPHVVASWSRHEGATLARAAFARIRLVLPDRRVVTVAPYGGWSLWHLVED